MKAFGSKIRSKARATRDTPTRTSTREGSIWVGTKDLGLRGGRKRKKFIKEIGTKACAMARAAGR